jgi:hypothetical protein
LNQQAEPRTETDLNRTGGTALQANVVLRDATR